MRHSIARTLKSYQRITFVTFTELHAWVETLNMLMGVNERLCKDTQSSGTHLPEWLTPNIQSLALQGIFY